MAMAALSAWATGSKQTMSRATDKQSVPAALKVPLLGEGLRLSDFSGMTPNPELKDKLLHVSGFIQNSPSDGKAATEDTEVWMGYTKTALFTRHLQGPQDGRTVQCESGGGAGRCVLERDLRYGL